MYSMLHTSQVYVGIASEDDYTVGAYPNCQLPPEPVAIWAIWTVSDTYMNMYLVTVGRVWGQNT